MEINQEVLSLSELQFTKKEIAKILEISETELTTKYQGAIDRGRLLAEAEVRKSIVKSAKEGNTSAQKQFMELNKKAKRGF